MTKPLIVLTAATLFAVGPAVAAERPSLATGGVVATPVQYESRWPSWDGNWRDDGRQMSIDERQARMRDRILRGFEAGRLTRREARRLEQDLDAIESKERAFEHDGRLGPREAAELHDDLDVMRERIRGELRDDQRRY